MDPAQAESTRARLNRLAWLLDSSIRVPGTDFRIGVDALLGLLPGIGDAAGVMLSSVIVLAAARMGVPRGLLLRMVSNIAVEAFAGAIPIAGDIFDAAWKANQRNAALLNGWLDQPGAAVVPGRPLLSFIAAALLALIVAATVLLVLVAWWIWAGISTS